jgi:large subunit ribosomal protein L15
MSLLRSLTSLVDKGAKRIGRGHGSGKGAHTVGRGNKGTRARKSGNAPLWFEGGQLPLVKRLPMLRGKGLLKSLNNTAVLSLTALERLPQRELSLDTLKLMKAVPARTDRVKIVATGTLTRSIHLTGIRVSGAARQAIEAAGGSVN